MARKPARDAMHPSAAPSASIDLRLKGEQLRGILDSASEAIVTADDSQTIVMANRAAASIFRCQVHELIGQPLSCLIPERLRTRHEAHVAAYGAGDAPARTMGRRRDVVALRADGEEFAVDAAISQAHVDGRRLYTVILRDLTEQRRTAAALHDSEQLLAATFNVSGVGLVQVDPATRRFVAVNEAFCRLTGYREAELLALGPDQLTPPSDRFGSDSWEVQLQGDAGHQAHKRLVRKDGHDIWVEVSGSVVRDPQGRPVRVIGVVQDISARRHAEDALRAHAARQSFLVQLNDNLRRLDEPQAISQEAARLLGEFVGASRVGYAEDMGDETTVAVGRSHCQGVPCIEGKHRYSDYGPSFLAAMRAGRTVVRPDIARDPGLGAAEKAALAALHIGATVHVPLLRESQLRAVFFVHAAAARNWTPEDVALFEEVAERLRADIERARAEAAVRAARAKLETALESMNDAVFISDAQGTFVDFNTAFAAFHRFRSKRECLTTLVEYPEILEVFLPDGTPAPLTLWAVPRALRGERGSLVEYDLRRKDTGERWTGSYSFAPIRDAAGRIVGSVVTARDITEIKRVRSELEASHADLQRMIAAQDQVQEQERLRIARELHDDMQQSLAAVLMEATAARAGGTPCEPATEKALARIERLTINAITSTRRIIQDLRPLALEELGLMAALQTLATRFAQHTGIACSVDAAAFATADDARLGPALAACLYRVTQEALTNVAKHSAARSVRIVLASDAASQLCLSVTDDGAGMVLDRQAKPQSFGLVGMRERVRAAGGTLRLRSEPGCGTTVEVHVPLPATGEPARS
ncbi:MAG TPA: PAS domain S-box protein [Burkholderiaceae bacterium]|nr:PAS domain S-box protein [Burkholderiaceae bacterium]